VSDQSVISGRIAKLERLSSVLEFEEPEIRQTRPVICRPSLSKVMLTLAIRNEVLVERITVDRHTLRLGTRWCSTLQLRIGVPPALKRHVSKCPPVLL
jgi:hypothetical protein